MLTLPLVLFEIYEFSQGSDFEIILILTKICLSLSLGMAFDFPVLQFPHLLTKENFFKWLLVMTKMGVNGYEMSGP